MRSRGCIFGKFDVNEYLRSSLCSLMVSCLLSFTETSTRCSTDAFTAPGIRLCIISPPRAHNEWMNEASDAVLCQLRENDKSFCSVFVPFTTTTWRGVTMFPSCYSKPKNGSQFKMSYTKVIFGVLVVYVLHTCWAIYGFIHTKPCDSAKGDSCVTSYLTVKPRLQVRVSHLTAFVKCIVSRPLL